MSIKCNSQADACIKYSSNMAATLRERQISLVHTRRPREALETYLAQTRQDLHSDSFCLRTIARCIRATGEVLEDPRYVALQHRVLDNLHSLDTRGIANVIFWMRINVRWRRSADLPAEAYKEPLRLRLEELIGQEALANRQLVALLVDLMYLDVKNTIFVESKLIDRLKNPHELFIYEDFRQILAFLANRKLKTSRSLFESTAFRMQKAKDADLSHDLECFKYVRTIMLSYNWDRLPELHAFLRERILKQGDTLTLDQINRIAYPYGENPNSPFGLEDLLNSLYARYLAQALLAPTDYAILLDYVKRLSHLQPCRLPASLLQSALAYFPRMSSQSFSSAYTPILQGLAYFQASIPPAQLEVLPSASSLLGNLALWRLKQGKAPFVWPKEVANLTPFELLQAMAEVGNREGEGVKVLEAMESMRKSGRKHQLYSGFLTGVWKGSFRWDQLGPVPALLLQWMHTDFPTLDLWLSLSFLRCFAKQETATVRATLQLHQHCVTSELVQGWIRGTEVVGDFDSYVHLLSTVPPQALSLHSLFNLLRFRTPASTSSSALLLYCSLLNTPNDPILSDNAFGHHMDAVLELITTLPGALQPFIGRLQRELQNVGEDFLGEERVLKALLAVKKVEEHLQETFPVQLDSFTKQAKDYNVPYLLLLFPHKETVTRLQHIPPQRPLPRFYSLSQVRDKFAAFSLPCLSDQHNLLFSLCYALEERVAASPLEAAFPLITAIAQLQDFRLESSLEVCMKSACSRLKTIPFRTPDLWLQALETLRWLDSRYKEEAKWVSERLEEAWNVLSPEEMTRAVRVLGELGCGKKEGYRKAADFVVKRPELVQRLGPDLIQGMYEGGVLQQPEAKQLFEGYLSLFGAQINPIDYGKVALAAATVPSAAARMQSRYAHCASNLSVLQRYLVSLAYSLPSQHTLAALPSLPAALALPLPRAFLTTLHRARVAYSLNSVVGGVLLPCLFHQAKTALWLPRATLYAGRPLPSAAPYLSAVQASGHQVLLSTAAELSTEDKAEAWLQQHIL